MKQKYASMIKECVSGWKLMTFCKSLALWLRRREKGVTYMYVNETYIQIKTRVDCS